MFEVNSLTAQYYNTYLRNVERHVEADRDEAYPTKPERMPVPGVDQTPSGSGLGAYLVVAVAFGLIYWI